MSVVEATASPRTHLADAHSIGQLARHVSNVTIAARTISDRRPDVLIARVPLECGGSAIVKLWHRPTIKGALRRLTGTNAGFREYRTLRILHDAGVRVPQPLGYVQLQKCRHTEALVTEDLGDCENALERVHALVRRDRLEALGALDAALIGATASIIDSGIVDVDHRLNNFLIDRDEKPVRIDLEHGMSLCNPFGARWLGEMLGTLVGSYVFAAQPRLELAESFAARLLERMGPLPRRARRRMGAVAEAMLERQRRTRGIDVRMKLF